MLIQTGERPNLFTKFEDANPTLQFAYRFAAKKIRKDMSLLDFGCGGAYGTEFLSRFTGKKATGYDIDSATMNINKEFYQNNKRLKLTSNISDLGRYDIISSFQVIEHIKLSELDDYLKLIKHLLLPGGIFFVATVNKNITSYKLKKPAFPFHEYEFTPYELENILKQYFKKVKTYGQIEKNSLTKLRQRKWSYKSTDGMLLETKVIRLISQWEFVRLFARILPQSFKNIFFPNTKKDSDFNNKYVLVTKPNEVENSGIFICECKV